MIMPNGGPMNMPSIASHMEKIAQREVETGPITIAVQLRVDGCPYMVFDFNKAKSGEVGITLSLTDPSVVTDAYSLSGSLNKYLLLKSGTKRIDLISLSAKLGIALDEIIESCQVRDNIVFEVD